MKVSLITALISRIIQKIYLFTRKVSPYSEALQCTRLKIFYDSCYVNHKLWATPLKPLANFCPDVKEDNCKYIKDNRKLFAK